MQIKKIVVATDFSEPAKRACDYVAKLAKAFDAEVLVLHAKEWVDLGYAAEGNLTEYLKQVEEFRVSQLAEALSGFTDLGIQASSRVCDGYPREPLLAVADEIDADLIVVAKRGHGRLEKLLVGSTTSWLLRHSEKPILVVPPGDNPLPEDWTHVLATTDFSDDSSKGLTHVAQLAEAVDAKVTVIHVIPFPTMVTPLPGETMIFHPDELLAPSHRDAGTRLEQQLETIGNQRLKGELSIAPNIAQGVLEICAEETVDLIVVPTHGKGSVRAAVLGSTSESIAQVADIPVLVLPRKFLRA